MNEFGEPWRGHDYCIQFKDGSTVVSTSATEPEVIKRIVACVNACAGIPTEELETRIKGISREPAPLPPRVVLGPIDLYLGEDGKTYKLGTK